MVKKSKIYISEWSATKPYEEHAVTDVYYLKLANSINDALVKKANEKSFDKNFIFFDGDDCAEISLLLSCYLEDIVSETNIFGAFRNAHTELYKKPLPYYHESEFDEYFFDEINSQDVTFLIWYYFSVQNPNRIILFDDVFVMELASAAMDVLIEEFDYAPENKTLKKHYSLPETETDYYKVRYYIKKLNMSSYLTKIQTVPELIQKIEAINFEKFEEYGMQETVLKETDDQFVNEHRLKLVGMTMRQFAAYQLGKEHPLYNDILNISKKITAHFLYKGQDAKYIFLEHIATDKKFNLLKSSYDFADDLKIDEILMIGIVRWKNEWWFSGMSYKYDFNADAILKEKNSASSRMQVAFLDEEDSEIAKSNQEMLKMHRKAFEKKHGGLLAFVHPKDMNRFISETMNDFNEELHLSKKEKEESKERMQKKGFFGDETDDFSDFKDFENVVIFFCPDFGIEIYPDVAQAFPAKNNPFCKKISKSYTQWFVNFLLNETFSKNFVDHYIDLYFDKIELIKTHGFAPDESDLDFLYRFHKPQNYYKPSTVATI